jgi:hypothetical protein
MLSRTHTCFVQIQATNFYFSGNNFDCNNCNNSCPSSATFQLLSGSGLEFFYDSENQKFLASYKLVWQFVPQLGISLQLLSDGFNLLK